jgi:phosphatidylserine/phosphatidylglycerophosphate/cardiolipin synthase-like enzyme
METMSMKADLPDHWWASGDMPVRDVPRLAFLIDGRMTMLEMCIAFLRARHSIHIAAWGISPELLLVRGKHKCAGSNSSPEQEELLTWLRAKGLSEEELLFWQHCDELSVSNVLNYAVNKGVDVKVLLWDTYSLPAQPVPDPKNVCDILESLGIQCLLDDSHKGILNHPLMAHHQKTTIVDGQLAFVGGIDMMIENNGDFDRWDTKGHPFQNPLRVGKDSKMCHSWHDVHVVFEGSAVADVERNFRQRWNEVIELHQHDPSLILPEPVTQLQELSTKTRRFSNTSNTIQMQVTRTIPKGIYSFVAEDGLATILETYKRAFAQAKKFIYIENQYFWRRTFLGFENPGLGLPNADMEELMQLLAGALARGVIVAFLLPDNPNVGREFTDEGLKFLWELAPHAVATGALQAYTLCSSLQEQGQTFYRSIYVHGKVTIVDDSWLTLGSANLNNRGMHDDTEMNVAIVHSEMVRRLRILLMAEHLGLCNEDMLFRLLETVGRVRSNEDFKKSSTFTSSVRQWLQKQRRPKDVLYATTPSSPATEQITGELGLLWEKLETQLSDPLNGLAMVVQQAKRNLSAIKSAQPLQGHLLPYIPSDRAQDYEVSVHAVNGWLDTFSEMQMQSTSTENASTH